MIVSDSIHSKRRVVFAGPAPAAKVVDRYLYVFFPLSHMKDSGFIFEPSVPVLVQTFENGRVPPAEEIPPFFVLVDVPSKNISE